MPHCCSSALQIFICWETEKKDEGRPHDKHTPNNDADNDIIILDLFIAHCKFSSNDGSLIRKDSVCRVKTPIVYYYIATLRKYTGIDLIGRRKILFRKKKSFSNYQFNILSLSNRERYLIGLTSNRDADNRSRRSRFILL